MHSGSAMAVLMILTGAQGIVAESRTAQLGVTNGRLEYDVAGRGPAVILIHGGLVDRRMWDGQVSWLAAKHLVVRYDLRGLGKSSNPTTAYSPLDDLDHLMKHLKIQKAILVGLSLGGMVAMDFALEHPERVEALVLCAPGLRGFPSNPSEQLKSAYRALYTNDPDGIDKLLDTGFGAVTTDARSKMRLMLNENLRRALRADGKLVQWPMPPTIERLPQIQAPTLVLIGTDDEPELIAIADLLGQKIPSATKIVLPGAKHHMNLDVPERFDQQVRDFIVRLPRRR
jgi:pimeloyl-ACP methyl ester carboxylesterase